MNNVRKIKYNAMKAFIVFIFGLFLLNTNGCKKEDKSIKVESPEITEEMKKGPDIKEDIIPQLVGTWKGKFDKREFILTITKQDSVNFEGESVIKYREQINQKISGTLDVNNSEITMKDLLHSRYAGTYNGKYSADWETITGKFTVKVDGNKFDFNLTRVK